jgi:DNA-binding transcriptional LysR family regulator
MMIGNELASGKLLRLLPGWAPRPDIAHAVFASRRGLLPSVRALIDFLAERFAALKDQ